MKTRLPKALLSALMGSMMLASVQAADEFYLTLGEPKAGSGLSDFWKATASANPTETKGDVTLSGTETPQVVGRKKSDGTLATFNDFYTTPTANWKVTGTLTIKENARVALGGQYKNSTLGVDEYTGLIADRVVVQGNSGVTNLQAYNAHIRDFQIDSGDVSLHNSGNSKSGNTSISVGINLDTKIFGKVYVPTYDSKQVRILDKLAVNGGKVTIGHGGGNSVANDEHCQTGFGNGTINEDNPAASTISQCFITQGEKENSSGGSLTVAGKSVSVGGLNITQYAGDMSISDGNYHIIADNGVTYDSKVTQNGNGNLTIGGILAENKYKDKVSEYTGFGDAEVHVEQNGNGKINMTNGIVFNYNSDATAKSSFTQKGDGIINLSGTFGRNNEETADKWAAVYFDVKQSGSGTINLKTNATMSAGEVILTDDTVTDKAKDKGGLVVEENATLTAQSISVNGGKLVNNGLITVTGTSNTYSLRSTATDNFIITDGELVNSGTINTSVNMTGGTLVAEAGSKIAGISATGGDILVEGDFTMTSDLMLDGDAELIFADADYTIDLGKYDVVFTGNSSIALTLGDADISEVVLFTGAKEDTYSGYKVALLDEEGNSTGTAVMEYNEDGTVTLDAAAVPEPTTATLSLLALAALAARRRRK